MKKEQIEKAEDFLGVKVLNPLEEKTIVGGKIEESHDHNDEGRHHHHHDHCD